MYDGSSCVQIPYVILLFISDLMMCYSKIWGSISVLCCIWQLRPLCLRTAQFLNFDSGLNISQGFYISLKFSCSIILGGSEINIFV